MRGWRLRQKLFDRRARAALSVAAVGVAVASLGTVALGSSSASNLEGRSRSVDLAHAIAVGGEGKLTVAGLSSGTSRDFALARYTAAGTLDRGFGRSGKVLTAFGARSYAGANSLAIRRDGKIVVAGWAVLSPRTYSGFAIARYTVAGKPDRTFGQDGKVLTYFGSRKSRSGAEAVTIQADGKVVAVGSSCCWRAGRARFALARFTQRGRLDSSFGRGGKVETDFGSRSSASAYAVAIQPDGKIIVAGGALKNTSSNRDKFGFALARYNADGTLDRSFGNRGRVETKVGDWDTEAHGLVIQPDGKIVLTGNALVGRDAGFALARYTADGRLDRSFGRGGQVFDSAGTAWALALQRDSKLVTAGIGMGRYPKFSVARFLTDGSRDTTFGRDRKLLTDFGATARAYAVAVRPDGKIVAAGTFKGHDFALACYTRTGRLDSRFGRGGKVTTDFGSAWAIRGRR
jgi:uncharacterized delta-60 repeat protein